MASHHPIKWAHTDHWSVSIMGAWQNIFILQCEKLVILKLLYELNKEKRSHGTLLSSRKFKFQKEDKHRNCGFNFSSSLFKGFSKNFILSVMFAQYPPQRTYAFLRIFLPPIRKQVSEEGQHDFKHINSKGKKNHVYNEWRGGFALKIQNLGNFYKTKIPTQVFISLFQTRQLKFNL